jgi:hypothetical protein
LFFATVAAASGAGIWLSVAMVRRFRALPPENQTLRRRRFLGRIRLALLSLAAVPFAIFCRSVPHLLRAGAESASAVAWMPLALFAVLAILGATSLYVEWVFRRRDGVARGLWESAWRTWSIEAIPLILWIGFSLAVFAGLRWLAGHWPRFNAIDRRALLTVWFFLVGAGVIGRRLLRPYLIRWLLACQPVSDPGFLDAVNRVYGEFHLTPPRVWAISPLTQVNLRPARRALWSRAGWRGGHAFISPELIDRLLPEELDAVLRREVSSELFSAERRSRRRFLLSAEVVVAAVLSYPFLQVPMVVLLGWNLRVITVWVPLFGLSLLVVCLRVWLGVAGRAIERAADRFAVASLGAPLPALIGGLSKVADGTSEESRRFDARVATLDADLHRAPAIVGGLSESVAAPRRILFPRQAIGYAMTAVGILCVAWVGFSYGPPLVLQGRLAAAVATHDADALRSLLAEGASPNRQNIFGFSPVSAAAGSGDLATLQLLLEHGGEIFDESWSNQPLHAASAQGKRDVVIFLLDKGAPINAVDLYGRTPLMLAIDHGHTEIALLLLHRGAHISPRDRAGETAQQIAMRKHDQKALAAIREIASR